MSSDDDDEKGNDGDFIPNKRKKATTASKPKSWFESEDSDNSEVERTKELIRKLTPVKEKTKAPSNLEQKGKKNNEKQTTLQKAGWKRKPVGRTIEDDSEDEIYEPSAKKVFYDCMIR